MKHPYSIDPLFPCFSGFVFIFTALIFLEGCGTQPSSLDTTSEQKPMTTVSSTPAPAETENLEGSPGKVNPTPSTLPPSDGGRSLTGTAVLDVEELRFLDLLNQHRTANGVPALTVSVALTNASDWMSSDMASKNYFSHTDLQGRSSFTRMKDFGYTLSSWTGENIACGNETAAATFLQWKNSSGHNANMLSTNYRVVGIGRAYSAQSRYRWYWTTDFGGK